MATSSLQITETNFDEIKDNLKAFLQSQEEFVDYDFDSSTLSILLDLLAYNTYQNAFYTNMVGAEMFLDSAQLRNSVVSRAKMLGYMPRSARSATATMDVVVTPDDSPSTVTVTKGTQFTTTIDGVSYSFVTPEAYSLTSNNDGLTFAGTITLAEGEDLTHRWTVSTTNPARYILPNAGVDTSSISVQIQESASNTSVSTYNLVTDLSAVSATSRVFYVQENEDSEYEIFFGDGVFGNKPSDGNIIIADYRVCNGDLVNGATSFSSPNSLAGYTSFTTSVTSAAQGGDNQESIDSVKYVAPRQFQAQDRLVTISDYKSTILAENGDIQSVEVWGGENNDPPVYGKVYISAKPTSGAVISNERKESIRSSLLTRNIVGIDTEFVDAVYLYIIPTIEVRYNPDLTTATAEELNQTIQTAVQNFETNNLGVFGNKFYLSSLIGTINGAEPSFVSTDIDIQLEKRFIPITGQLQKYIVNFNNAIKEPVNPDHTAQLGNHNLFSSAFEYSSYTNSFFDDDGSGTLRVYQQRPTNQVYVLKDAGTVNYNTGVVTIDNLNIISYEDNYLSMKVNPLEKNIFGDRNQILLISGTTVTTINNQTGAITSAVGAIPTSGTTTTNITDNATISTVIV